MDAIRFVVPGSPVPNPRMRTTLAGHRYTPDNGIVAFKAAVALMARMAARKAGWEAAGTPHAINIQCVFARPKSHLTKKGAPSSTWRPFPPKKTSGDGDNLEKGVWDAITKSGAVWHDDDQIVEWGGAKRYAGPGESPCTIITIRRTT
jgi:Holliday junction resolvase RusA-like endonuclease